MILVVIYLLVIIIIGTIKKIDISSSFMNGVKESYPILKNLLPSMMFFLLGVNVFLNSGIINVFEAFCARLNLIPEVIIQFILRPVSNSSSLIMMTKVFEKYGTDSLLGIISTLIQASTDTSLYIVMVYFSVVRIKKMNKALVIALLTNVCTMFISILLSYLFFNLFK